MLIYNDKGRIIQTKSTNATGGTDVLTTQYGWQGLPLIVVQKQEQADANPQTITTVTKSTYDELGRVVITEQKQAYSGLNGGAMSDYTTISELEYDALGQVKTKTLAPEYDNNAGLENLEYEYNIRGWLLGTNREYITQSSTPADKHFGFDLGYDKDGVLGTYTPQYNGNISGTIWKSAGDEEKRKYDFDYDGANRILKADFGQHVDTSFENTIVNFSMKMGDGIDPTTAYDANGNIKKMQQWGLTLNGSKQIDDLTYHYIANTNRLQAVDDPSTDYKLGDFTDKNTGGTDYDYDLNGNLISDANKDITGITYNYLNLPEVITVTGKGTITYTYDAAGNRLTKVTQENNATVLFNDINYTTDITTTTTYIGGSVYESKAYSHSALASLQYTDELQFMAHSEGRIRPVRDASNNITAFTNDYFLKDHLGNIRMVLTEQKDTSFYPPASMEAAQAATEEALYANISETRVDKPAGYPNDTYTNPNDKVALTNGNGNKIGPSIILKVMAGDKFNLRVSSWYKANGANPGNPNSMAADLVAAFINSLTGIGGFEHGSAALAELENSGAVPAAIGSFLSSQPAPGSTQPKAYINWVLLDEQFKFVQAGSGAEQVGADQEFKVHTKADMSITKNGYLYVFVSNETPNIDVYWDNLQITHIRGQILEETHYYPFGLTMAGISSKAANSLDNKTKFNGKDLNEDLDLDWYEYGFRNNFDPQLGRFHSVDPLASDYPYYTPYQFAGNQPTIAIDVDGLEPAFVNDIMTWLTTETAKKPNGAAAVTLGVVAGTGKFIEKTITGVANLVTNPPDLSPQSLANSGVQLGLGVFDRVNTIQNGSTVEKTAAITETVLDVASVVVGTKGAGAALKGEAIASTAGKIENVAAKGGANLTKSQLKSISSLEGQIATHQTKLAEYIKNPMKFDNKGFLKNAPNDAVRQKIIQSRINHLQQEIQTFQNNIQKIINGQ